MLKPENYPIRPFWYEKLKFAGILNASRDGFVSVFAIFGFIALEIIYFIVSKNEKVFELANSDYLKQKSRK